MGALAGNSLSDLEREGLYVLRDEYGKFEAEEIRRLRNK